MTKKQVLEELDKLETEANALNDLFSDDKDKVPDADGWSHLMRLVTATARKVADRADLDANSTELLGLVVMLSQGLTDAFHVIIDLKTMPKK